MNAVKIQHGFLTIQSLSSPNFNAHVFLAVKRISFARVNRAGWFFLSWSSIMLAIRLMSSGGNMPVETGNGLGRNKGVPSERSM